MATATTTRGFTPSKYQAAIFEALAEDIVDVQVNATAGSGKSTTLIEALHRVPYETRNSTLLCAFNKEIANCLLEKVPEGVTVKTIHALGFAALCQHIQKQTGARFNPKVDDRKYRRLIESWWVGQDIRGENAPAGDDEDEMFRLLHFVRVTLTNPTDTEAILATAEEREIELSRPALQAAAVAPILKAGQDVACQQRHRGFAYPMDPNVIDFDDMVTLPFYLEAQPKKFRLVMVDEAQDLSSAQLDLVLKCRADGGRMVFVGDENQAIFAFAGADSSSWKEARRRTGARQLPLSICYRCPRAVIELAQTLVPTIEAAPNAEQGVVETIRTATFRELVNNSDMVLCRLNAPLISTAFRLIGEGTPAKVRGRDIGAQLVKLIDQVEKLEGFDFQYFMAYAERYRDNQARILAQHKDNETKLVSLHDRVDSVQAVYVNVVTEGGRTMGDLRAKVDSLFSDHQNGCILLSSIHKAKGLEADRVFLLRPDKIPHPMAKSEAAREQENNLHFVAITRAMREFYYVAPDPEER